MKTRYRHIMARVRGDKQPDVIVGVACDTHREAVKGRKNVERIRLDRWYATVTSGGSGSRSSRTESVGGNASAFWRMVERLGASYRHILIVSKSAVLDWSLLGVWETLEDERIFVVG